MPTPDAHLQHLLDATARGDQGAYKEMLNHACERLLKLTRNMLRSYPDLRRWTRTDIVCQAAESPPDTTAALRERIRLLCNRLAQTADRETLTLTAQVLARLAETSQ